MPGIGLRGLASFLHVLNTCPTPDEVVAALLTEALAPFGATDGVLMHARGGQLELIGTHGLPPGTLDPDLALPIGADLPICHCVRESEVIAARTDDVPADFSANVPELARWLEGISKVPDGWVVAAPALSRGIAVGAYGFGCPGATQWGTLEIALLDAVSSALGMWMTHPDSGLSNGDERVCVPALTDRQREVLALVARGLTNAEIGQHLGYSESTVKQDVVRAMRILEMPDRMTAARRAAELGLVRLDAR